MNTLLLKKKNSDSDHSTPSTPPKQQKKKTSDATTDGSKSPTPQRATKRSISNLFGLRRASSGNDEKRKVAELLLGSALRRFSLSHPAPLLQPGTLRVIILSCSAKSLRSSVWGGSAQTKGTSKKLYLIRGELEAARGKTNAISTVLSSTGFSHTTQAKSGRDVVWSESDDRVIRLYFPGDSQAKTADPVINAVASSVSGQTRRRPVLHLRLCENQGGESNTIAETAIELDRVLAEDEDYMWNLPLIAVSEPEVDFGALKFKTSFNRVKAHHRARDSFSEAAENLAAEAASLLLSPTDDRNGKIDRDQFPPVMMLPSAAAAIASVATGLSTKGGLMVLDEDGKRSSFPEYHSTIKSRQTKLKRFPTVGCVVRVDENLVRNFEQLESLREGWRMWRTAHRSQLQPSHRADLVHAIGDRFVNTSRLSSSSSQMQSVLSESDRGLSLLNLVEPGLDSDQKRLVNHITARLSAMSKLEQKSIKAAATLQRPGYAKGKTCVITGATRGVGAALATFLVKAGIGKLIVFCREVNEGRSLAQTLLKAKTDVEVDVVPCDLTLMKSTAQACDVARNFLDGKPLDFLILCAAAVFRERVVTVEGLEQTFACNYMSNFLIVHSLFDVIEKSPGARIIVASCATFSPLSQTLDLENLQGEKGGNGFVYESNWINQNSTLGLYQYNQTKLMLTCFVSELAHRLRDKGSSTTANIFHPGAIKSKLSDDALESFSPFVAKLANAAMLFSPGTLVRTPEQGAMLGCFLANDIDVAGVSGKVFDSGFTGQVVDFSPKPFAGIARDGELCKKLWSQSGRLLNSTLGDGRVAAWWGHFAPNRHHKHDN